MNDCYLVYKTDDSGQFPMYRTTDGKIAVMLFKSHDSAQGFIDDKGMSDELIVVQTGIEDTARWLRDCIKNNKASLIAVDPDPKNSSDPGSHRVIPIVALLIEWEGRMG